MQPLSRQTPFLCAAIAAAAVLTFAAGSQAGAARAQDGMIAEVAAHSGAPTPDVVVGLEVVCDLGPTTGHGDRCVTPVMPGLRLLVTVRTVAGIAYTVTAPQWPGFRVQLGDSWPPVPPVDVTPVAGT